MTAEVANPPRTTRTPRRVPARRALLALPAAAALLAGLDGALSLLGVWSPGPGTRTADVHGTLMTLGFVGAFVALERAVALRRRAGYLAPACLAAGALLLLAPHLRTAGAALFVAGSAVLVAVYVQLWRRRYDAAVLVQGLGAVLALGATVCSLGGVPLASLVPWLAGFLVLTIAGERLELARLRMPAMAERTLLLLAASVACSALTALLWPSFTVGFGIALGGVTSWLFRYDIARHTVRAEDPARFMALSMLAAQAWLGVAAAVWLVADTAGGSSPAYDASVHAVFLGFTMSMVMAHAPVILPAVSGMPLSFHRATYVPLLLLHLGLVVRLWLGDALGVRAAWQTGGVLTVLALLGFLVVVGWSLIRRRPEPGGVA
ncbi:hypothetical protein [Actinophytocola sp. KF-1]